MGPLQLAGLPPRSYSDGKLHPLARLVAHLRDRHPGIHSHLRRLLPQQGLPSSSCRTPPPTSHPRSTIVRRCPRLCHRPPDLQGQQHHRPVDRFSKMVHFIALPKLPSSAETADLLTTHVIRLHGIPHNILSDHGPKFTSWVWQAFCRGVGATASLLSGYHPETNGQAERANQALEATLRSMTTSNPASWSLHLPWVEYSLNTMVSSATGLSPFQCSLGYQPPLFPSQETEAAVPSVRAHFRRCRRVWKAARDSMLLYIDRVQRVANRRRVPAPVYHPGQKVWLLAKDLPLPTVSRKLAMLVPTPYSNNKYFSPPSTAPLFP